MAPDSLQKLRAAVRDVPDFPKAGIIFKDITPILASGALFRASIDLFLEQCHGKAIDKIVGIDARGFLFGSAVAYELGIGFVPLRKKGRLPYKTESAKYSLEYGEAEMELHIDAIEAGEKIVLIDDLLATGGTSASARVEVLNLFDTVQWAAPVSTAFGNASFGHLLTPTAAMLPITTPSTAPAHTSVGKCEPLNTRDTATKPATRKSGTRTAGKNQARTVAAPKAFAAWPDGKESNPESIDGPRTNSSP